MLHAVSVDGVDAVQRVLRRGVAVVVHVGRRLGVAPAADDLHLDPFPLDQVGRNRHVRTVDQHLVPHGVRRRQDKRSRARPAGDKRDAGQQQFSVAQRLQAAEGPHFVQQSGPARVLTGLAVVVRTRRT